MTEYALLEVAVAERDRMLAVVTGYRRGDLSLEQLPTDAHTYPGRIVGLNVAIEQVEKEHGFRPNEAVLNERSQAGSTRYLAPYSQPPTPSTTKGEAAMEITTHGKEVPVERREIDTATASLSELYEYRDRLTERVDELAHQPYPGHVLERVSAHADAIGRFGMITDAIGARERGVEVNEVDRSVILNAHQKAAERLLEEPGVREALAAQDRAYAKEHGYPVPAWTAEEYFMSRPAEIEREWRSASVTNAAEAGAATNYYRGRADEWNSTRQAIATNHPELSKDLPPAIQVDEIRVRQQVIERDRGVDKSLAIAR